jgi:hypothetical protein
VESDKHAELLAAHGLYATLYQQQFEKVIARAGASASVPDPAALTPIS